MKNAVTTRFVTKSEGSASPYAEASPVLLELHAWPKATESSAAVSILCREMDASIATRVRTRGSLFPTNS